MKKHLAFVFLLPILLLNLISCTKTGPQGPQGAAGMNGTNGTNGNANVFTDTFTVRGSSWISFTGFQFQTTSNNGVGYPALYYDIPFGKITQGIIDSGMVSIYLTPDGPDQYLSLPYSYEYGVDTYYYVYVVTPGNVRLETYALPNTVAIYTFVPPTFQFKIVAVAGNL